MADYFGNINLLPDARVLYNEKKSSIVHTRATDNCLFGFGELPSEKELLKPDFITETPNPAVEHLIEKFSDLLAKFKKGIDIFPFPAQS